LSKEADNCTPQTYQLVADASLYTHSAADILKVRSVILQVLNYWADSQMPLSAFCVRMQVDADCWWSVTGTITANAGLKTLKIQFDANNNATKTLIENTWGALDIIEFTLPDNAKIL
jgi:hypothetical protein